MVEKNYNNPGSMDSARLEQQRLGAQRDRGQSLDLRTPFGWALWLSEQEKSLRDLLTMGAFHYESKTDSILLVFPYDAHSFLNEDVLTEIFSRAHSFYAKRLAEWLEHQPSGQDHVAPREVIKPHLSFEVAPPRLSIDSH
jgi:hypothetical protein